MAEEINGGAAVQRGGRGVKHMATTGTAIDAALHNGPLVHQ